MKQHHARTHGESLTTQMYDCPECGTKHEKLPCRVDGERSFCSRECHQAATAREGIGDTTPSGKHVNCETCGEEIYRYPYQLERAERHYCSRECKNKGIEGDGHHNWNGGKVTVECDWCGDPLQRHPSEIREQPHHFCAKKGCQYKWLSENRSGEQHPSWEGGHSYAYGHTWKEQREKALERDGYECRACGMSDGEHREKTGKALDVHHVVPIRKFDDPNDANSLGNLVTACKWCHSKYEGLSVFPE